jgi:hypothetical protein
MTIKWSVEGKKEIYGMAGNMSICHSGNCVKHSKNVYRSVCMHITNQLPLFATYRVHNTVHNIIPHYMFRLYGHLQVCHVYKNAKLILKLNGFVNIVSNELQFKSCIDKNYTLKTVNHVNK